MARARPNITHDARRRVCQNNNNQTVDLCAESFVWREKGGTEVDPTRWVRLRCSELFPVVTYSPLCSRVYIAIQKAGHCRFCSGVRS